MLEDMHMTGTSTDRRPARTTWRERVFVLGGLALAALGTAAAPGLGWSAEHIGLLWMAAIAWTVLASLAHVLWLGLRRRDWSAFRDYAPPDDDGEFDEWASRTGRYTYLRDLEERLRDDEHLR